MAVILAVALCVALLAPTPALALYRHSYRFTNKWAFPTPLPALNFMPHSMSPAGNGNLLFASGHAFVSEYTTGGVFVGNTGTAAGLDRIDCVAVGSENMWVQRAITNITKKLTLEGADTGVSLVGHPTAFNQVSAVSVDASGCVYVADHGGTTGYKMRITKYAPDGTYITTFGTHGTTNVDWLWSASSVVIAPDWSVYVADAQGHYIRRYTPNTDRTAYTPTARWKHDYFTGPQSLAVDAGGNVFVLCQNTKTVTKLDSSGRILTHWGGAGTTDGRFTTPRGLVVGADGHVFVSDRDAVNVQEFEQVDVGPITSAAANVIVKRGRVASLRYLIQDDMSTTATVTLKVYRGGSLKATLNCGTVGQGTWRTKAWRCNLATGIYTWKVYARDAAGNAQRNVAVRRLTVR